MKSPIVGTYYESPSPGSPPFVTPGDRVTQGQVLCIVEAMKLMNEIESDVSGRAGKDSGQQRAAGGVRAAAVFGPDEIVSRRERRTPDKPGTQAGAGNRPWRDRSPE